eukprot:TRINITY_DN6774_c0_g1_i7.p1 TRINITY_DN6774_c0_g1~~TRINITY_DN6774_c0_g1_i7.p1  ORF type:complete len:363 (-),score=64.52 TRINITY_DN6774_c0_g1_i7:92-1087(-)
MCIRDRYMGGNLRERWTVNPSAKQQTHKEMFKFLGSFMGMALRQTNYLELQLSPLVWKILVGETPNLQDLDNLDRFTAQCLDEIKNIEKKGVDEKTFVDVIDQKFITFLSDGTEVELVAGGKDKQVTFHNRDDFIKLVIETRLNESKTQISWIREGLLQIVPEGALSLLQWTDLERLICGYPDIDPELLKKYTNYGDFTESDNVIKWFWKIFEGFSREERVLYLRFVWGRSTLPLKIDDLFGRRHKIDKMHWSDADKRMPQAHTCFFSIDMPVYSSMEIMKTRLKYAITNCTAIDTDGSTNDVWNEAEIENVEQPWAKRHNHIAFSAYKEI